MGYALESGKEDPTTGEAKVTITDGTDNADVDTLDTKTDNIDTLKGLVTKAELYGRVSDTSSRPCQQDASTYALSVIDYEHHEIHAGRSYRVQHNDDAIPSTGSGGELVIAFHVPAGTTLPHMVWEASHQGDMTIKLLEGVTLVANGTDVTCKNSRRDAGDSSILQGYSTGALVSNVVSVGEQSAGALYSGGAVVSLNRDYSARNVGGGQSRRDEVILKADTDYAFVLDNNETSPQGGQIRLEWYEHTDKE